MPTRSSSLPTRDGCAGPGCGDDDVVAGDGGLFPCGPGPPRGAGVGRDEMGYGPRSDDMLVAQSHVTCRSRWVRNVVGQLVLTRKRRTTTPVRWLPANVVFGWDRRRRRRARAAFDDGHGLAQPAEAMAVRPPVTTRSPRSYSLIDPTTATAQLRRPQEPQPDDVPAAESGVMWVFSCTCYEDNSHHPTDVASSFGLQSRKNASSWAGSV